MTAILRRELGAYFSSPIGYIFLAVFYIFASYYFVFITLLNNSPQLTPVFSNLFMIVLFLIPILTMRLLSEDQKNRTDQALLTAPISLTGLVIGKFLAALFVFLLGVSITLVFAVIVAGFTTPDWAGIFANIFALTLVGASLISIGMFISSLTENQVIAAVGGFAAGLGLMLINSLSGFVSNPVIISAVNGISFLRRYTDFTSGVFDFSNVLFFFSVCALFIFFTVRVLEKRRWA